MGMVERVLDLRAESRSHSLFLFGPRQTGKTTLMRRTFPESRWYNLLDGDVFLRLSRRPHRLYEEIVAMESDEPIIIDEIQKLPQLLDEAHLLMESAGRRFVISGSSAAKLRRGGVNLLGGRARTRRLYPLISAEIPEWNIERAARYGTLPPIWFSGEPEEDLRAYCGSYLQQEVQAEGLVRGIDSFARFLSVAGQRAGETVVFEHIASDAQVPARTVREFYHLLEDTLLGTMLPPFAPRGARRKAVSRGKFYFFDNGVANVLAERSRYGPGTTEYGRAIEHLVHNELQARLEYSHDHRHLAHYRTLDGTEVDFVITDSLTSPSDTIAIEVKTTKHVQPRDLRGLKRLAAETTLNRSIVVCFEAVRRVADGILIVPAPDFFDSLWSGTILER